MNLKHVNKTKVKEASYMQTMGSVSGQMCTKTMVSGLFAFISWIYLAEGLYTVSYPWVPEPRGLERTNGQLVTNGIEPIDTFTVNVE